MAGSVLALVLTVLVFYGVDCISPPQVDGSYIAWGEIVQPIPYTDDIVYLQMSFEESYDVQTQNAAFFLWLAGKNMTFVKNHKTKQTFLYIEKDDKKMYCSEINETEWSDSDFEPNLLSFEDDEGTIKFSLYQLFNIPQKYSLDELASVSTIYRGIPAKSWTYEIKTKDKQSGNDTTLSITSYWSDGTTYTSGGMVFTPLGFNVSKLVWPNPVKVEDYTINVFGVAPDAYDHKYFEPFQGIICPNRVQTLKFPNVKDIKAISLHSEMVLPDYQEIRYIDTWFDPLNQLVRVDVARLKDENPLERKQKRYQSEVAIGKLGVVYRLSSYKGESSCEIIPFSSYENDMQNFLDIKQNLTKWKMGRIFGLNDTTYVYIGETTKNDIPCHLFQGIRTDWPDKSSNISSLWEWCFNVNMSNVNDIMMFRDDEFGMISAQITILSAPRKEFLGYRMTHHFYEVKAQDPKMLDATSFDIVACYSHSERTYLQFYLGVIIGDDNKILAENSTSDINFLQKWKSEIYRKSGLPEYSLRLSNVRATIDDNKIFVKFTILDVHEGLPSDIKKGQISSTEAEKTLRENVDAGKLSIKHEWKKGENLTFEAVKGSLSYQIDPKFNPQTLPPLPLTTSTVSTLFPFSLATEPKGDTTTQSSKPDDHTSSSLSTEPGDAKTTQSSKPDDHTLSSLSTEPEVTTQPSKKRIKTSGNQPGAVAGVSIAMLLVGMSIGTAGTYYKSKGLPPFLRG